MLQRVHANAWLAEIEDGLDALVATLAASAVQRDRAGGHAGPEKELLRQHGLLLLSVPQAHGGVGADWPAILRIVRRIARVDSSLAHLLAFQHLQLSGVLAYGTPEQQARLLGETVAGQLWWGNAANPADPRLHAKEDGAGGLRLDGVKGFCSGARGSAKLITSALLGDRFLIGVVATGSPGITIHDDWDPVGQRQTDSTSVSFADVRLAPENVLFAPGQPSTPFLSLRGVLAQLILVHLFLGIAEGAVAEARHYTLTQSRPWATAGVARAADDPYVVHRYAEMHLANRAAAALADEASQRFEDAWQQGAQLDAVARGHAAVAAAEAKVLAHRAALGAGENAFDVCGARAARAQQGLDRFWRNARTHTLHDPVDYKLRDIGRWALDARLPEPSLYS
ncbi:MAG: acyl-CoA dehydrogenase [Comamonadaceae bacterium]|nr:MAG: acyl-CoA dehydrogenase [Comamonadaceae bacterium]